MKRDLCARSQLFLYFFEWKTDYVGLRCVLNRASEKSDQQKWDGKGEIS